jgi:N-acetylmuramoyl-L-alanine amidase
MRTIILSCAHGLEVQGKQSPNGTKEAIRSRRIQYAIADILERKGVNVVLIPERGNMTEIGLWKRVEIENTIPEPAFVFSLHMNAAGSGKVWKQARGIEIWTSIGQTKSDEYATLIYESLQRALPKINGNFPLSMFWRKDTSDGDVDKECNFTELMSKHPAVLLEWLFQDNVDDVELLSNDDLNSELVDVLVDILFMISVT